MLCVHCHALVYDTLYPVRAKGKAVLGVLPTMLKCSNVEMLKRGSTAERLKPESEAAADAAAEMSR